MLTNRDRATIVKFLFRYGYHDFSIEKDGISYVCRVTPVSSSDLELTSHIKFVVWESGSYKVLPVPALLVDRFLVKAVDETCDSLVKEVKEVTAIEGVSFRCKSGEDYQIWGGPQA